eukprot:TRINITY_DN4810_c0_g4_i1.p1 TRINITY_DN4810_c0_g4~~TRINITY_DN4810_c0_g4_i1.p1  ORF type:complete len:631 (-),score=67.07 TRINITY_DN4810_c0_g4_i1:270-2012(-)
MIPEAVCFALAAGLPASVGLNSSAIVSIAVSFLGARPALICGTTGSLVLLIGGALRATHGPEYLFYAVILSGALQVILGLLSVNRLLKITPAPVIIGFCNGLALIIALAMLNNFKDPSATLDLEESRNLSLRFGAFSAFYDGVPFLSGLPGAFAITTALMSFLISLFWSECNSVVPSALIAVMLCTAFEWSVTRAFISGTPTVGDVSSLNGTLPSLIFLEDQLTLPAINTELLVNIFPLSISMASVGILETLLTMNLVDEKTKTSSDATHECLGLGIANIMCGALGGMGGCGLIGQSMINIGSGARSRLSSLVAGLVLLVVIAQGYIVINRVPVAALVGVMLNVVYNTFEWSSFKLTCLAFLPSPAKNYYFSKEATTQPIGKMDASIIWCVTISALFANLAVAVVIGIVMSLIRFTLDTARLLEAVPRDSFGDGQEGKTYDISGPLFFGNASRFLELFDEAHDPDDICLSFQAGRICDLSAVEALNKLGERYGKLGKRIRIEQLQPHSNKVLMKVNKMFVEDINVARGVVVVPAQRRLLSVERAPCFNFPCGPHSNESSSEAGESSSDIDSETGSSILVM